MNFTIRALDLNDMDQAAVVHRTSFDERLPSLAGLHTASQDRDFFRQHLFVECALWGAYAPELAGIVACSTGWIEQLYVLPNFQHCGIGRALLDKAKSNASTLQLWTFKQNLPAQIFYEKNGFIRVEETDGSRNEAKAPDILYRWDMCRGIPPQSG